MMRTKLALAAALVNCASAGADTINCENVYVGRIVVESGQGGLSRAVFLNNPGDISGSYWVHFLGWSSDDKRAALALLTAAKLSGHRVHVMTTQPNGCGIQADDTFAKQVVLANSP